MRKIVFAALAAVLLASASAANATTFILSYADATNDFGISASIEATEVTLFNWTITDITGLVFGNSVPDGAETITGLILGGPGETWTPSGQFYIDNVLIPVEPGTQVFDGAGLGFYASGAEWNLWGNGAGSNPGYTLGTNEGGSVVLDGGSVTLAPLVAAPVAAPEASTWAMMGLGFAGLAFAGYRSRRSAAAIA